MFKKDLKTYWIHPYLFSFLSFFINFNFNIFSLHEHAPWVNLIMFSVNVVREWEQRHKSVCGYFVIVKVSIFKFTTRHAAPHILPLNTFNRNIKHTAWLSLFFRHFSLSFILWILLYFNVLLNTEHTRAKL